jgi:citrate synthase
MSEIAKGKTSEGGLDGVVAANTRLSDVDGEQGRLILAGHDVEKLAAAVSFEEACALFWEGALPDAAGRERTRQALARGREHAWERLGRLGDALEAADGMDALRAAVAHLPPPEDSPAGDAELTGAVAVYATAWARKKAGAQPIAPDAKLSHAADYLRMLGLPPDDARIRALDTYLVTVIDHGMNASTFTARVIASTASDATSAVVGAIGALKGPLHGGAPGPVLDMLEAVGTPDHAVAWLEGELAAGRRIMGMGHRIYRVRDPRAAVLEKAVEKLEQAGARGERLKMARAVEAAAVGVLRARHPDRPLQANVEFYTAVLLDAVGLPRTLFTPTFAAARTAGWLAHVREQKRTGRIIRPASRYVGPVPQ